MTLNPEQFLFHGTADDIKGNQILPAKVHGGTSNWGATGDVRGEPANEHAWAHPDEAKTWEMAHDRANYSAYITGADIPPRPRVFAVRPNANQSPGHDDSIKGEIKSTHFDIDHPIDIQPGHQGTFPGVNWNQHVTHPDGTQRFLPGSEDANHPDDHSIQYGHRLGVWGADTAMRKITEEASEENAHRRIERRVAVTGKNYGVPEKDTPLPIGAKTR